MPDPVYDAIIVGTGACGGWAAQELTAKGLTVLVLDAGPLPVPSRHYPGTCRMGADPKSSVLDPFCRMHDVPNVYVFGGGAFAPPAPTTPPSP